MNRIKIEKLVFGGSGIGRSDDSRPIFVAKSVPGDILDVEITSDKKSHAFAKIKKVVKPSNDRIAPECPYFEKCGGCDHQNISYKNQLKYKDQIFEEVLARAGIREKPEPIIAGSDKEFFYRNSIRFMFLLGQQNQIAFARHGYPDDNKLVTVDKCLLQSEKSNEILEKLQKYINVNIKEKKTFWQLKIREGKRTGDIMVEIITSADDLPGEKGIVEILKSIQGVKSIYHTIAPAKSLLNLRRRLIFGSPVIFEKIGSYTFQISPESFFQTNSEGVKTLYDLIKKLANLKMGQEIVDLFSGTGTIGIYLSTLAKKVTGVEVVREAINDARDNARINKVKNCEFLCSDILNFKFLNFKFHDDTVIVVDPPRAGLSKDLIFDISHSDFDILIYVSCNPATFARDLKYFEEKGVIPEIIQPVDMFPQTHHIEVVAKLIKPK